MIALHDVLPVVVEPPQPEVIRRPRRVPEREASPWPWVSSGQVAAEGVGVDADAAAPWPGSLPVPAPATVVPAALSAGVELVDIGGRGVGVDGGGDLSGAPAGYRLAKHGWVEVVGWAGPWTIEERWWTADAAEVADAPEVASRRRRRRAHLQVLGADGTALVLVVEAGRWSVVAIYD